MKSHRILICIILTILVNSIYAQQVTKKEAQIAAMNFLEQISSSSKLKSSTKIEIDSILILKESYSKTAALENILGYVFLLKPSGFIVTTANKQLPPILAYSNDQNISLNDENKFISFLRQDLKRRNKGLLFITDSIKNKNTLSWESKPTTNLKSTKSIKQWPEDGTTTTGGWIETTWTQGAPYNVYMPIDPITNNRSVTGCVSTALAQIINYHKYIGQVEFTESDKYVVNEENRYPIKIDNDSTLYDFPSFYRLNQMLSSINNKYSLNQPLENNDIAALQFACAISLKSGYASYGTAGHPNLADDVLKNKFNYQSADYIASSTMEFYPTIITNIQEAKPCIISIKGDGMTGHSLVVDGYRTDGFYHLNFGWGESSPSEIFEAWYMLPEGMPYEYDIVNAAVCNILPQHDSIVIEPKFIQLFPTDNYKIKKFSITSEDNLTVNNISGNSVMLSVDSSTFSNALTNIEITANTPKNIWVKYEPADTTIADNIKIEFSNGHLSYVLVKGFADGSVIDSDTISGVWSDKTKPYLVLNDIVIDNGNVLTINEGVTVYMMNHSKITVRNGKIIARGTASNPVVFTSLDKETGWNGIRLMDSGEDDIFMNCQFTNSFKVFDNLSNNGNYLIEDAVGGAIYCENSSPTIINCFFSNNKANLVSCGAPILINGGGAIGLNNSSANIVGCIIVNNLAKSGWTYGGGMYILNSSPKIVNTTISKNEASIGGGIYSSNSEIEFINTIIWDNYAQGIGYYEWTLDPEIVFDSYSKENALWKNSILKENYFQNGVIGHDPKFIEPSPEIGFGADGTAYNWSIQTESPAINNGISNEIIDTLQFDIYGNPRTKFSVIDIGAVECQDSANYLTIKPIDLLSFEPTLLGDSLIKEIQLINTGTAPISINSYQITSDSANIPFHFSNTLDDSIINPSDTTVFQIVYKPLTLGKHEATLELTTDSRNYPSLHIPIEGISYHGQLIQGEVSGIWNKQNGPYNIIGDIWVKTDNKLEIQHGSEVIFYSQYKMTVGSNSRLSIKGTIDDTVKIYGLADWYGIHITNSGMDDEMEYCRIENVKNYSAVNIENSQPCISHSHFSDNQNVIEISSGGATISNNYFNNNIGFIISGTGKVLVNNNIINGNNCEGTSVINYSNSDLSITNNIITNNTSLYGPIHGNQPTYGRIEIINNYISNNFSTNFLAISLYSRESIIKNNTIVNNSGTCPNGSNILYLFMGKHNVTNNTICNNSHYSAAVSTSYDCQLHFHNNILFNNSNSNFTSFNPQNQQIDIQFSDIDSDTITGVYTNINSEPLFISPSTGLGVDYDGINANWQLQNSSPCIDKGNPDSIYNDIEDPNNPGYALSPALGTIRNDIGAYGGGRNNIPYFSAFPDTNIISGIYFESIISYNDLDSSLLFIGTSKLPGWLSLKDNKDGTATLSGTPTSTDLGENQVIVTVTDGIIDSPVEQAFMISVINSVPEFTSIPDTTAHPNDLYTYQIEAADENGDSLMFSYSQKPDWLSLTDNKDGTATLSGTPTSADLGENQVIVTVTDGIIDSPVEQAFTISVDTINVGLNSLIADSLKIYPNPTSSKLIIENYSNNINIKTVTVLNILGRPILTYNSFNDRQIIIDLGEFKNGIYLINIKTDNKLINKRIIKN